MTRFFRVCIIVPQGYMHSQCFIEAGFLLKHSLSSLGVPCDIKLNDLAGDRVNIVLGWHLLNNGESLAPVPYIPYQLEQLSEAFWDALPDAKKDILFKALDVWDYSLENIAFLKDRGRSAQYAPLGYHECLERIPQGHGKDIDVLFFGSVCERRRHVLDLLSSDKNIAVRFLFGVYGKDRDDAIARSRIILNIHHYESQILETVRISYLLNNRCFVISEQSAINPYKAVGMPMVPYADLVGTCRRFLADPGAMESLREASFREFKENYPMTEILKKVIF
jgi:hypothetical protein